MTRVIGPPKSKRRHWTFLICLVAALGFSVMFIPGALGWTSGTNGVQDTGFFQLDGNTRPTTCPDPAANTQKDDWAALWTAAPTGGAACSATAWTIVGDGIGGASTVVPLDDSYWAGGGSKDAYDPQAGPWMWSNGDVAPDKDDLVNAFAAIYDVPDANPANTTGSQKILYFGSDRYAVNGDAQQGFWFLQANTCLQTLSDGTTATSTAACPTGTSGTPTQPTGCTPAFTGTTNAGLFVDPDTGCPVHHTDGDILIVVNFNNGGTLGLAGVFEWCSVAVASGGCLKSGETAGVQQRLFTTVNKSGVNTTADCKNVLDPNDFCSTANTAAINNEPVWPYVTKGNNNDNAQATYPTSAFIEGGVNLARIPGAGTCFPTFIAETRSSSGPSTGLGLTAQLKDLAMGKFELCGSSFSTTPKDGTGGSIPSGGLSIGTGVVTATDSPSLTVTGTTSWSGTLDYYICGPVSSDTCDVTKGKHIGSQQSLDATHPPTNSDPAYLTKAGRYCWAGVFHSNTAGVQSRTDNSATECFTVKPAGALLQTQGSNRTTDNAALNGTAIDDTGSLSGTATEPGANGGNANYPSIYASAPPASDLAKAGGTITFKLYGPSDTASCVDPATGVTGNLIGTSVLNIKSGSYTGGDGTAYKASDGTITGTLTPPGPGEYWWTASYSGDSPNTLPAPKDSSTPPNAIFTGCGDTDEHSFVQQLQPTMTTHQRFVPNDSATVTVASGAGNLAGNVRFQLFVNNATCDTTVSAAVYDSGSLDIKNGTPNSGTAGLTKTVSSNNSTSYDTTGTTFSWLVTYTSTNNGHKNVTATCNSENSSITIDNDGTFNTP